jgi:hypothetical protein
MVVFPYSTASRRIWGTPTPGLIQVRVRDPALAEKTIADITAVLTKAHHVKDFDARNNAAWTQAENEAGEQQCRPSGGKNSPERRARCPEREACLPEHGAYSSERRACSSDNGAWSPFSSLRGAEQTFVGAGLKPAPTRTGETREAGRCPRSQDQREQARSAPDHPTG